MRRMAGRSEVFYIRVAVVDQSRSCQLVGRWVGRQVGRLNGLRPFEVVCNQLVHPVQLHVLVKVFVEDKFLPIVHNKQKETHAYYTAILKVTTCFSFPSNSLLFRLQIAPIYTTMSSSAVRFDPPKKQTPRGDVAYGLIRGHKVTKMKPESKNHKGVCYQIFVLFFLFY